MSDREIVTFDAAQFARLDLRLETIGNALVVLNEGLGRQDSAKLDAIIDMLRSAASVPAELGLARSELSIIHGLVANPEAINNLIGKVNEFMATQEERLQTIQGQMTSIADGINKLQDQLAQLKLNNPALDDEISAIEATAKAIGEDLNPPSDGGGETSDTSGGTTRR